MAIPQACEQPLRQLAEAIALSPHNLVSRSERAQVYERHVVECAAYAAHLPLAPGRRWLDLGTGGGLPGLVLAVLRPDVSWTLVDATRKKVAVVAEIAVALGLGNVTVIAARAEELARQPAQRGRYDGAITRALADLPVALELMRGFVRAGGWAVCAKGPAWPEELERARPHLAALRFSPGPTAHVDAAPRPTWLVMMRARGAAPAAVPRRTGIPQTRPLGGS